MNNKLKPCPFCGGDAEVLENITNPNRSDDGPESRNADHRSVEVAGA